MALALTSLLDMIRGYWAYGALWIVYLLALGYMILQRKKREKDVLVWTALLYVLALFNPVSYFIVSKYILNEGASMRLFWGVPYAITVAYTVADLVRRYGKKLWMKVVSVVVAVALVAGCGNFLYSRANFDWNTNKYGLPQVAVDMLDVISQKQWEDLNDLDREELVVAFPEYICSYVLQYEPSFKVLYGRDGVGGTVVTGESADIIFRELSSLTPDYDALLTEMDRFAVDYFATYFTVPEAEMIMRGCRYLGEFNSNHTGNYKLFENRREMYSKAIITMYPDETGTQGMFYTIEEKGRLVVVDGGHAADADKIRWIAGQHGNKIDAWIITHGHPDHVGAFNELMSDPRDIVVGQILTIDFDLDLYHQLARDWDEPAYYDEFYRLLEGQNVTFLHTGDVFSMGNLTYEVFSAYDDNTQNYSEDICNRGSLVFKVSSEQNSMLFMSDVAPAGTLYEDLMNSYGARLKADYLQMAHHGNNTNPQEFVELVAPKVAFFDTPDYFFEDDSFQSAEAAEWVKNIGGEVVSYGDAPYRVTLY